jgi:putative nucleotidyltransferase with HDIG domain
MSSTGPSEFLHTLARALSVLALYPEGHAARERVLDYTFEKLRLTLDGADRVTFGFLEAEVLFQGQGLREMRDWDWAARLATAGIQSVEFEASVTRDELEGFLDAVLMQLGQQPSRTAEMRPARPSAIRWGAIGLRDEQEPLDVPIAGVSLALGLVEEAETLEWIHGEITRGAPLPLMEAETVVRSLAVAMHGDQELLLPLAQLRDYDEYTTTHSLNVSVLAMALAEWIGLGDTEIRSVGVAGLLHDVGKVCIPHEVLIKPGKLTAAERMLVNRHPVAGAEVILESQPDLDLAAIVAYEHHIMIDGGGYPRFAFPRECHYVSRLVHVCDVYDALRTDRPYRGAWPQDRILDYIRDRAGSEFDPTMTSAFLRMISEWEPAAVDNWRGKSAELELVEQVQG